MARNLYVFFYDLHINIYIFALWFLIKQLLTDLIISNSLFRKRCYLLLIKNLCNFLNVIYVIYVIFQSRPTIASTSVFVLWNKVLNKK